MPALLALLSACSSPGAHDNPPIQVSSKEVDLNRFFGRWYIVANIPYYFEKGYLASYVEDFRRPDGDVEEDYYGKDGSFEAPVKLVYKGHGYVVPGSNNARLRMTNLWPIYASELILDVAPDYSYALIGYPDRSLGWIFSRKPMMDDATYQNIMKKFADHGYDTTLFKRVPQFPEQLGKAGFQDAKGN